MSLNNKDDLDNIFDDQETEDLDSLDLGEDEMSDGLDDELPVKAEGDSKKTNYKDKYEKSEKSRRHQQRFVTIMQAKMKKLEESIKENKESESKRNQRLAEVFGFKNPEDEKAKAAIAEYEENPIAFIEKLMDNKINQSVAGLKDDVAIAKINPMVEKLKNDIESEYDVIFTPEMEVKVAQVLRKFTPEYKAKNQKQALLEAVIIANNGKLNKRGEDMIVMEEGGKLRMKGPNRKESVADRIKREIGEARPSHKAESLFA